MTEILGAMRIKNEARWIARVIESQLPLIRKLYILDDHSTDGTPEICARYSQVVLFRSELEGLDESRDKQWLLDRMVSELPAEDLNENSPWWVLALDGDEVLEGSGPDLIRRTLLRPTAIAYSLQILYLWDREDQVRVDGVYRDFRRPSLFRLINPDFRYQRTPWGNGANFHCSSIPQEYLGHAAPLTARVLHLGYLHREDRLKKFAWYNRIDPDNKAEDGYRHMVLGDLPEYPAEMKTRWAGPLTLESL